MAQHHGIHGAAVTVASLLGSAIEHNEGLRLNWGRCPANTDECPTVILPTTLIAQYDPGRMP
jgi:hypothetical protein